ncbi:MAG: 3-phosphoshikimate 1-carboxyvinyltransferase [Methanocorpusculum sp.]|nr:3-phosphoshikimate 1-carboxyvinyltransferase [Methanocorpusculum sp.]
MTLRVKKSNLFGEVFAPPSKSHTHREYILAALSCGTSEISSPLFGDDTNATLDCLEKLGAKISVAEGKVKITGGCLKAPSEILDCRNSGTAIRILAGVASKIKGTVKFTGDASLCGRPMKPLLNALEELGAFVSSENGCAPFSVSGVADGASVSIRGDISSQFISALLISAPLGKNSLRVKLTTELASEPYVDMTVAAMKIHGVEVLKTEDGFFVEKGQTYHAVSSTVSGDYSSAAFMLTAGALLGKVTVDNLLENDTQGDSEIITILKKFGADVKREGNSVTVSKSELRGAEINLSNAPDLFPIVCTAAAFAQGITKITGAAHLKFKESNRIKTTAEFLKKMGADITETDDGCVIVGKNNLVGTAIHSYGDHRIAMSAVICGLCAEGETVVDDIDCAAVSYPGFVSDIKKLGGDVK